MIKKIYTDIQTAILLLADVVDEISVPRIKHIDIWNQNVEFLEKDDPFVFPATFIEFVPIRWETLGNRVQEATVTIKLHIVTKWFGQTAKHSPKQSDMLTYLDLPDQLFDILQSKTIDGIGTLTRTGSDINHNHEKYVDSVEEYQLRIRFVGSQTQYEQLARPAIKIVTINA